MFIVPCQSFADSSHRGIVERQVQCAQSPIHLVESAAPSGSSPQLDDLFNELQNRN